MSTKFGMGIILNQNRSCCSWSTRQVEYQHLNLDISRGANLCLWHYSKVTWNEKKAA